MSDDTTLARQLRVDAACDRFEAAWQSGPPPEVAEYLAAAPEADRDLLREQLERIDAEYRRKVSGASATGSHPQAAEAGLTLVPGSQVGRYRLERVLGQGGFGVVYLARDGELRRRVAVKIPHRYVVPGTAAAATYLAEARAVAGLDHPHVVPVYDVGSTPEHACYIVSKYIDGQTLARRIAADRPGVAESAGLVAAAAEALHHAHRKGLVHRDVKPGNILLDADGKPFVVDFGLALAEENVGHGPEFVGTPAYMSPEQARGEGHRVDGRSDVFSLGVVLYELLTGQRPFRADSPAALMDQITRVEPHPPRQHDDTIPKELERICLKALAKRPSDRYSTAREMADDLRHVLALRGEPTAVPPGSTPPRRPAGAPPLSGASDTATPTPTDGPTVRVVPKGLRSFDAYDADFFLELLPGPRDRDGLPESIRFWKARIEGPEPGFPVGLIYGPSGCGKSSLVKAGLLPRLSGRVTAVYVEAAGEGTEVRLLNALRRHCPGLPAGLGLKDATAALRRGQGCPAGGKVLIVLDQFEQWLHDPPGGELVDALRQCDGRRVQCVVTVRDDFWLAVSRFLRDLDVSLVEGQNCALVDLFDEEHARKVLAAFGRAYGRLPEARGAASAAEKTFLAHAVAGLAERAAVVPVRLALFAEMMKGRVWTPNQLREVGGAAGVGVAFLDETFSAPDAPPEHRYHQRAAREVLQLLLPHPGADIKRHMRSREELLAASGCDAHPKEFDALLRVLDGELRLITPTGPDGAESTGRHYQLTHDYLVPALRDWLARKRKETRRGRAELLLADRAAVWAARPEDRQLPSLRQWLAVRWLTRKAGWAPAEQRMMARAGRYHATRGAAVGLVLAVATVAGLAVRERVVEQRSATHAAGLVRGVLDAETAQVPGIVSEIAGFRRWTDAALRVELSEAPPGSRRRLHASLALLAVDDSQIDYLFDRLLIAEPTEVAVIRDALATHRDAVLGRLWAAAEGSDPGKESRRLRAAAALATIDADDPRWDRVAPAVAAQLVAENPLHVVPWMDAFRPARERLFGPLAAVHRDPGRPLAERDMATIILTELDPGPAVLAELLMDAAPRQFAIVSGRLQGREAELVPRLIDQLDRTPPADAADDVKEATAKRQANAAVALLRVGRPEKVVPLLRHSPDPRARSYLIHRLAELNADPTAVARLLDGETDLGVRRALILSLGGFTERDLAPVMREGLQRQLQTTYQEERDPGLHAAAEWLLRTLKHEDWLRRVNETWATDPRQGESRVGEIRGLIDAGGERTRPQWYVTGAGQTMVVMPGPVEFRMGSPETEAARHANNERPHVRRIGRSFAVGAKLVTLREFARFDPTRRTDQAAPSLDCPVVRASWYQTAAYCNWLSGREGIPPDQWCFDIRNGAEVRLKPDYLKLTGYRMPTEAESEYATRAGSATGRHFGEAEDLLPKYAWYVRHADDHSYPVGRLKPNDLGLFDSLGNTYTWCVEHWTARNWPGGYPVSRDGMVVPDVEVYEPDPEDKLTVRPNTYRVIRGGAFFIVGSNIRSAYRNVDYPTAQANHQSFRLARTIVPGS